MDPRQVRKLIWALAISGFLNIILSTSMVYWMMKERPPSLYCKQKPSYLSQNQPVQTVQGSSVKAILRLQSYPYEKLLSSLKSIQQIENGYLERDFALACLVAIHHFDLQRALSVPLDQLQKRKIVYARRNNGSNATLVVFPALDSKQFDSIYEFANHERWPRTSKGLFLLLQKQKGEFENSLLEAFYLTPEFQKLELLFRNAPHIKRKEIIQLLIEGEWLTFGNIMVQQTPETDVPDVRRQNFLLEYVQKGSPAAAYLLLKSDFQFAVKKIDDYHTLKLLSLLTKKTELSEKYMISLLKSPRSDAVWKSAATCLYDYAGENAPNEFQYQTAISRFVPSVAEKIQGIEKPQVIPEKRTAHVLAQKPLEVMKRVAEPKKQDRLYIVQEGDNLWKLSRRFNVPIVELKQHNRLFNDVLKPGSALRIPSEER